MMLDSDAETQCRERDEDATAHFSGSVSREVHEDLVDARPKRAPRTPPQRVELGLAGGGEGAHALSSKRDVGVAGHDLDIEVVAFAEPRDDSLRGGEVAVREDDMARVAVEIAGASDPYLLGNAAKIRGRSLDVECEIAPLALRCEDELTLRPCHRHVVRPPLVCARRRVRLRHTMRKDDDLVELEALAPVERREMDRDRSTRGAIAESGFPRREQELVRELASADRMDRRIASRTPSTIDLFGEREKLDDRTLGRVR
jgi:hypothetical protein